MNIDKFEVWVHDHILKNEKIRKVAYGTYQRTLWLVSPKIKSEGNIIKLSPDDGYEYLFGYYDKCPWDESDRYILALRVKSATAAADSKEKAELVTIDIADNKKVTVIATTTSWNVQQGCMAQWLDENHVLYNDFRDGRNCAVIVNLEDKSECVLDRAVYALSSDKKTALSLDFSRLHRLRPGYGYANVVDSTEGEKCPDKTCIWKIDIESGQVTSLLKYTDFANFEPRPEMVDAEHKVNHLMISPSGKRFMVLHRWFKNGEKFTRLVTCNIDGTDMYNLSDDDFVSHCCWKNDQEILSYLNKKDSGKGYYLMKDKSKEYEHLWPSLVMDGHPTYSYNGKYVVTDTYPDRKRIQSIYVMDGKKVKKVARVFSPFKYGGDVRCDLHPRWSKDGKQICFDGSFDGKRGIYAVSFKEQESISNETKKIPRIIHYVWFGHGEKSQIVEQSMNSWNKYLGSYKLMEWNEDNFDVSHACQYVQEAYKAKKWAFVSDYVRLKALYEYGGFYFDTDLEVFKNLDEFLRHDGLFCTESHYTVSTAIIVAKPHASWIKDLLDEYENISFYRSDGSLNTMPNTKRVQRYLENRYGYHWSNMPQELEEGLFIYPAEYFSPLNCVTGIEKRTANTYAIHHYDNTWKSNKEKMRKKFMQICTRIIGEDNREKLSKMRNKGN